MQLLVNRSSLKITPTFRNKTAKCAKARRNATGFYSSVFAKRDAYPQQKNAEKT